jgi:hypothetical protein
MLKIVIEIPKEDDIYDMHYDTYCELTVSEDATLEEATYAWFKALEIEGYSPKSIQELMEKFEK